MASSSTRKRDRWDSSSDDEDDNQYSEKVTKKLAKNNPTGGANENEASAIDNFSSSEIGSEDIIKRNLSLDQTKNRGMIENDKQIYNVSVSNDTKNVSSFPNLPRHNPLLSGCRLVYDSYERLKRLDEGTYGIVWKARDIATDEVVALKQVKFDSDMLKEGFPVTAMREISVLLDLSHECIVSVREMVVGNDFDKVFMVMEFMEMDLKEAMKKSESPFPQSELKSMLFQILSATQHVHNKWYLHRDLKTSNILVHKTGKVALCDFGLARKYQMPLKALTQMVITLWYRPPELLFGQTVYGPEVDMWSIGCIFGELIAKEAMIQGQGELDQIDKIFKLVGTPTDESWPDFSSLPNSKTFRWKMEASQLYNRFQANSFSGCGQRTFLDGHGFDLLQQLLTLDPKKRINANDALEHSYFKEGVTMQNPCFNI